MVVVKILYMVNSLFTKLIKKSENKKTLNVSLLSQQEALLIKGGLESASCPRCDAIGGTKPPRPPGPIWPKPTPPKLEEGLE